MILPTLQAWDGEFGRSYTDRNDIGYEETEKLYQTQYGLGRRELNQEFFGDLPRETSILEVGCNVGNQLVFLSKMGFTRLAGIELQEYALARARERLPNAELVQGSALALPFPEHSFDLVFTSGVLIHIAPNQLPLAMGEIYRVAQKWIFGLEYYAERSTEIPYRGHSGLLWKAPFSEMYQKTFQNLKQKKERYLRYLDNSGNVDHAYLLKK